ncbi:MAG: hypothetical protein IJL74_01840 [Bacilli bacterium]|nr:hypothetical protein [Bacilli bacterium]
MNKKTIAIIIEVIPILSAIASFILIVIPYGSGLISHLTPILVFLSLFGFVFFFIGKKLCKGDKIVKILGILDLLSTAYVLALYIVAIFVFGL